MQRRQFTISLPAHYFFSSFFNVASVTEESMSTNDLILDTVANGLTIDRYDIVFVDVDAVLLIHSIFIFLSYAAESEVNVAVNSGAVYEY